MLENHGVWRYESDIVESTYAIYPKERDIQSTFYNVIAQFRNNSNIYIFGI